MKKAVILGANGNIAQIVSKELHQKGWEIVQFSRNPKKVNGSDQLVKGNLLDPLNVENACEGADIVFLLAGVTYNTKSWQEEWPKIMRNTLDACITHSSKLVFFDNMYACDPSSSSHLTENTPLNPSSKKGRVRMEILQMLWREVAEENIKAIVTRSADFYGPNAKNSFLNELVIEKMKSGKSPQWLYNGAKRHSFTYIPDAAKATAFLALQGDSWNQTWNLPTDSSYPSGEEIVDILNRQLSLDKKLKVLPGWTIWILGFFVPALKEIRELQYQLDQDYCLDSSKFEKTFNWKPTSIEDGVKSCL
ncbi:MAG: NAD-dependent epimerase/dehydratase family protein [Algoriphagus sp.]|uniref:NAD-dependent epimerase/dehydratase family protein n=1 Tax=Algoriphagus sp. TaxID=1872435 RepID=UPI0017B43A99|nr:NAD-dependent epimerase/dehydratase family protein [Algoriphagus sp.]NVJ85745.1 NAD-dependent epimerase/dehydratase family protein [Algoriphagus sp.]